MEIRQRLDYFLAKIAGKDVNIADLTPPQAINPTEELMLDIAEKIGDVEEATEAATVSKAGVVKMAAKVSEAASTAPTAAEFKALLDALKDAGIMAK